MQITHLFKNLGVQLRMLNHLFHPKLFGLITNLRCTYKTFLRPNHSVPTYTFLGTLLIKSGFWTLIMSSMEIDWLRKCKIYACMLAIYCASFFFPPAEKKSQLLSNCHKKIIHICYYRVRRIKVKMSWYDYVQETTIFKLNLL